MRTSPLLGLAFAVALAGLSAVPASAQRIPSPYRYIEPAQEVGFFVQYVDTDLGRFGLGPESALALGARYAVEVSGPFGFEGGVMFLPTERVVVNPQPGGLIRLDDPAETSLVFIDARARFALTGRRSWKSIQPFVSLGGQIVFDVAGDQEEDQRVVADDRFDFGTEIGGVFGVGARIFLTERVILRTEAGLNLYQLEIPEGFRDPALELEAVPESEWVNAGVFTVGLGYAF